jgi:hypothetical protein
MNAHSENDSLLHAGFEMSPRNERTAKSFTATIVSWIRNIQDKDIAPVAVGHCKPADDKLIGASIAKGNYFVVYHPRLSQLQRNMNEDLPKEVEVIKSIYGSESLVAFKDVVYYLSLPRQATALRIQFPDDYRIPPRRLSSSERRTSVVMRAKESLRAW